MSENEERSLGELETRRDGGGAAASEGAGSMGDRETLRDGEGWGILEEWGGKRWAAGEEILGRYVVEKELGQGGMGVVYACFDKVGGVRVAVKALPPEVGRNRDEMEEIRENFRLVSGLRHPNIAGVRTLEKDGRGEYFLVMDLAEGESLRRWMRRKWREGGLPLAEAIPILRQVAAALDYAHGEKVAHRDVKPGNVVIDGRGRAKVLDFGLAAQIRTSMSRVSRETGRTSGTRPYMAPEQWEGQAQDARTDQYALGVVAYEMLAGRAPFEGDDADVLRGAVLTGRVRGIAGVGEAPMEALRRALAKKPGERFGSCGEFVDALERKKEAVSPRMPKEFRATGGDDGNGGVSFLRKGRLERDLEAASREIPMPKERGALEKSRELFSAGAEAMGAGDRRAAEGLFAQAETGLAAWKKDVEMRGERERREEESRRQRAKEEREAQERARREEEAKRREEEAKLEWERKAATRARGKAFWKRASILSYVAALVALSWWWGEKGIRAYEKAQVSVITAKLRAGDSRQAGETKTIVLPGGAELEMVHCPGVAGDFWMGKTEVTQEQWQRVMGKNPSHFAGKPKNPVENVSWNDCTNFVAKLNALPAARASGLSFRLPTEEEWKTACRAGAPKSADFCKLADGTQITSATLGKVAQYGKEWDDGPISVESFLPNAWGLYDMHGNVWEWTQTAVGDDRVSCGGSFDGAAGLCSAGYRNGYHPDDAFRNLGLRLAASGRAATR